MGINGHNPINNIAIIVIIDTKAIADNISAINQNINFILKFPFHNYYINYLFMSVKFYLYVFVFQDIKLLLSFVKTI